MLVVSAVFAVGCASEAAKAPPAKKPQLLTRSDPEPAGANCPFGGLALRNGLDRNGNGVLDDSEVEATQYACNPSTTLLTRRDPLPPSVDCPAGGVAIQTGIDANGDGTLEDAEIQQTVRRLSPSRLFDVSQPLTFASLRLTGSPG